MTDLRSPRDHVAHLLGDMADAEIAVLATLASGLMWSPETRACLCGIAKGLECFFASLSPKTTEESS